MRRRRRRRMENSNDRTKRRRKIVDNQCNYNGEICSIDNSYNGGRESNDKSCKCKCSYE
jgi:hypothetical protein